MRPTRRSSSRETRSASDDAAHVDGTSMADPAAHSGVAEASRRLVDAAMTVDESAATGLRASREGLHIKVSRPATAARDSTASEAAAAPPSRAAAAPAPPTGDGGGAAAGPPAAAAGGRGGGRAARISMAGVASVAAAVVRAASSVATGSSGGSAPPEAASLLRLMSGISPWGAGASGGGSTRETDRLDWFFAPRQHSDVDVREVMASLRAQPKDLSLCVGKTLCDEDGTPRFRLDRLIHEWGYYGTGFVATDLSPDIPHAGARRVLSERGAQERVLPAIVDFVASLSAAASGERPTDVQQRREQLAERILSETARWMDEAAVDARGDDPADSGDVAAGAPSDGSVGSVGGADAHDDVSTVTPAVLLRRASSTASVGLSGFPMADGASTPRSADETSRFLVYDHILRRLARGGYDYKEQRFRAPSYRYLTCAFAEFARFIKRSAAGGAAQTRGAFVKVFHSKDHFSDEQYAAHCTRVKNELDWLSDAIADDLLDHPNIAKPIAVLLNAPAASSSGGDDESDGPGAGIRLTCTVSELVDGGQDLFGLVSSMGERAFRRGGDYAQRVGKSYMPLSYAVPERSARRLFRQIASAMAFLHARGISHGDIKPENIMVTPDLHCKVIDFGFSRRLQPLSRRAPDIRTATLAPGDTITEGSTCAYFPPESRASDPEVKLPFAYDTFMLGNVLLFLTALPWMPIVSVDGGEAHAIGYPQTGFSEWVEGVNPAITARIGEDGKPSPRPDSAALRDLLRGMMCAEPRERFSMAEVAAHPWTLGTALPRSVARELCLPDHTPTLDSAYGGSVSRDARSEVELDALARGGAETSVVGWLRDVAAGHRAVPANLRADLARAAKRMRVAGAARTRRGRAKRSRVDDSG